jgi:biotin carboxyl carrier protein
MTIDLEEEILAPTSKEAEGLSDYRTLVIGGEVYRTKYTTKYAARKPWTAPDQKRLLSIIPGLVSELSVKEGQHVDKGQTLLVLEAMKMLNRLPAQISGTIKKIYVKEGETIPKGIVILEFE